MAPRQLMALATRALATLSLLAVLSACSGRDETAADAGPARPSRLEGQIRVADSWLKVAPPIYHDARMDLATRCLLQRDDAKAKGQELPLCYDPVKRPGRAVTTIAVERDQSMAAAMARLTATGEATHFVVDHNGAIYQVLDLAWVARHGGAYPAGEVRVIACERTGEEALVAALRGLYPAAQVTIDEGDKGP